MLRNRVITALILAPLVVAAIYMLNTFWFAGVIALVFALASYEWAGFCTANSQHTGAWSRWIYVLAFLAIAAFLFQFPAYHLSIIYLGTVFWCAAIVAVLLYPRGQLAFSRPLVLVPVGFVVLISGWLAVVQIHSQPEGPHWLLWALVLVWAADVGAYFAGRAFGSRKLAPHVSPGKTWEGALGGLALAMAVCGAFVAWWQGFAWLGVALILAVVSIFGDLFESLVKRSTGVKDSGTILPGHGGILDRIDSIFAVLPLLTVLLVQP